MRAWLARGPVGVARGEGGKGVDAREDVVP